jgi:hypothetical protein
MGQRLFDEDGSETGSYSMGTGVPPPVKSCTEVQVVTKVQAKYCICIYIKPRVKF